MSELTLNPKIVLTNEQAKEIANQLPAMKLAKMTDKLKELNDKLVIKLLKARQELTSSNTYESLKVIKANSVLNEIIPYLEDNDFNDNLYRICNQIFDANKTYTPQTMNVYLEGQYFDELENLSNNEIKQLVSESNGFEKQGLKFVTLIKSEEENKFRIIPVPYALVVNFLAIVAIKLTNLSVKA